MNHTARPDLQTYGETADELAHAVAPEPESRRPHAPEGPRAALTFNATGKPRDASARRDCARCNVDESSNQSRTPGGRTVRATVELGGLVVQEARPLTITGENCRAQLGVTKPVFYAWLDDIERDGVPVIRRGKLRAVLVDDFEAWVRSRPRGVPATVSAPPPANDPDAPRDFAAELGLVEVRPARAARKAGAR